jgi:hypothetical protein
MNSSIDDQILRVLENKERSIKLRWRHLQDAGCVRLAKLLAQNSNMVENIDLAGNDIGDEGVESLCETLSFDSNVKVLSLNCNSYREAGMNKIASMLRLNSTLTSLDISGSRSGGMPCFWTHLRTHFNTYTIVLCSSYCLTVTITYSYNKTKGWNK